MHVSELTRRNWVNSLTPPADNVAEITQKMIEAVENVKIGPATIGNIINPDGNSASVLVAMVPSESIKAQLSLLALAHYIQVRTPNADVSDLLDMHRKNLSSELDSFDTETQRLARVQGSLNPAVDAIESAMEHSLKDQGVVGPEIKISQF